jgi:methenyltetrahydromethanopterin cyclohydrolase
LVEALIADAARLCITVGAGPAGARVVDAGIACPGSIEAGLRIAAICMGGLGQIALQASPQFRRWPWSLTVTAADPVLACLGSQYAGWQLVKGDFFALGSGPGRAQAAVEELFDHIGYRDAGDQACLVLEVDKLPPAELVTDIAAACRVAPSALTLILTPTTSLAGTTQVVGRVLEVALHKAHVLGFPLQHVVAGAANAPLPVPAPDFLNAMGRTNDAILFGGQTQLWVTVGDDEARDLAHRLPSSTSPAYGRPFAEVFAAAGGDFFAIDGMLFSPARVIVSSLVSGRSFAAGALDEPLLDRCFGAADG